MYQKLPVSGFKWKKDMSKFTEEFRKSYDEDSDKGDIHGLHEDLPFLPERMKIGKCKKFICNLYD